MGGLGGQGGQGGLGVGGLKNRAKKEEWVKERGRKKRG